MTATVLPEYVVNAIHKIAKQEAFLDGYTIENDAGAKHGDGFTSVLICVTVTGTRQINDVVKTNQKLALLCKIMPDNLARRELFCTDLYFEREAYMYNTVFPYFVQFQRDKGLSDDEGFFAFPKCYYAVSDVAADQFAIIMEDLRDVGYEMLNKLKPIPVENVELLMRELAKLHAVSFAVRDQNAEFLEPMRKFKDVFLKIISKNMKIMDDVYQRCFERCIKLVESDEHKEKLETFKNGWKQIFNDCLGPNVAEPFSVLGHSDCWTNNMLFLNEAVNLIIMKNFPKLSF